MTQAPGTVGVVSSLGPISGAIRLATRSHWSHVIVANGDGTVTEALGGGVVTDTPESTYDNRDVVWLSGIGLTAAQRTAVVTRGKALGGSPYNYFAIVVFGLRFFGLPHQWLARWANGRPEVICSELALLQLRAAGVDPWPGAIPCTIAPADFADMALRHDWA